MRVRSAPHFSQSQPSYFVRLSWKWNDEYSGLRRAWYRIRIVVCDLYEAPHIVLFRSVGQLPAAVGFHGSSARPVAALHGKVPTGGEGCDWQFPGLGRKRHQRVRLYRAVKNTWCHFSILPTSTLGIALYPQVANVYGVHTFTIYLFIQV